MKILVVRRDNIGDLVCTTPLLGALRRKHPSAWIGALVNSYNAAVLDGNRDVDEVVAYTKLKHLEKGDTALSALARRLAAFWRLRRSRLDLAILATTDFSPRMVRVVRMLAPQRVVGFADGGSQARLLDASVPIGSLAGRHEVERVYALAPLLALDPSPPPLKVVPRTAEVEKAAAAFPRGASRIAVHISARRPKQRWPAERFAQLIRRRCAQGAAVMLLWSPGSADDARHPGDDEKAAAILAGVRELPVAGYPTQRLEELIGALAAADAVLCSDGGAMHVAAALGKPIACFFGDSPLERWRPWQVSHRVIRPTSGNVADVGVDEADAALASLLS